MQDTAFGGKVVQGPQWVVELVYNTPMWFQAIYAAVGLGLLGVAALGLHRSGWELDADLQREMIQIGAILVGVISATTALVNIAEVPYYYDVFGGWIGGVVLARLAIYGACRFSSAISDLESAKRLALAWATVGTLALFLPSVLATQGHGTLMLRSRLAVLGVGAAMAFYNVRNMDTSVSSPA